MKQGEKEIKLIPSLVEVMELSGFFRRAQIRPRQCPDLHQPRQVQVAAIPKPASPLCVPPSAPNMR